jgi:hypothetical protein
VKQLEKGRLYQVRDRGLRHERQLARKLASGMLAQHARHGRIAWFADPAQDVTP